MTRGRGRGNTSRASKMSFRGRGSTSRVNMPTVPIPITSSQQGGTNSSGGPAIQTLVPTSSPIVQTSCHGSTPSVHSEPAPVLPNRSNATGEGASTDQRNIIGESTSSQNNTTQQEKVRAILTLDNGHLFIFLILGWNRQVFALTG